MDPGAPRAAAALAEREGVLSNYASSSSPPRTLTELEQKKLLQVSGEHRDGFRDHVIFSLALGAGLREHEIVGLNVQDVIAFQLNSLDGRPVLAGEEGQYVRRRVLLSVFKGRARAGGRLQETILADQVRYKLQKYLATIKGRPITEPLFKSRNHRRLSTRQVREMFANWQQRAGFERRFRFHDLRHTYCTNVYRESGRDIEQVKRLARHSRIETSLIYTHASDEELLATVKKLRS
jgi:integrase/recombinase XerC